MKWVFPNQVNVGGITMRRGKNGVPEGETEREKKKIHCNKYTKSGSNNIC